MNFILSSCHFLAAIIFATLSAIITIKDRRSPLNLTCAGIFGCLCLWSMALTVVQHPAASAADARFFERIGSIGWIWFTFFFLWFAWLYTKKPQVRFFRLVLVVFICIPLVLTYQQIANDALISSHLRREWGWVSMWSTSAWTALFFVYYSACVGAGLNLIVAAFLKSTTTTFRQQSMVMVTTGLLSLLFGTAVNVIIPIFSPDRALPIADITTLVWAFGLAFVVFRYRLLDITPLIAAGRIIDVMNDLLFLLDLNGRIISVNRSAATALACSEKQLVGRNFAELMAGDGTERDSILALIKTSPSNSVETVLMLPPGPVLPVSLSTSLIPGSGIVCVAHDISLQQLRTESLHVAKKMLETEVARATAELQNSNRMLTQEIFERKLAAVEQMETEERFRVIFEKAPDGIYLTDADSRLLDANIEALRIWGIPKDGIDRFSVKESGADIAGDGAPVNQVRETVITRSDGATIPVEISTHPVKIGGRELFLGVIRDISQRKKTESEAEQLRADLHQAQKMEAIGLLAGGIAHDFNNLLGGIIGYSGLLHRQLGPEQTTALEMAGKIHTVARQATERVAQLLAFARKGKYRVEPVNMHAIINQVISLLEHTIDKKITLASVFHAEQATVSGDSSQLHSAILNLGVNARDALPGGGTITFITSRIEITPAETANFPYAIKPGTFLKLMVKDTGIGMDQLTRTRIFEPFFSTKTQGKGTGLGLASVYGTIKNHNGFIELESAPGKGTTFTLGLPLLEGTPAETSSTPPPARRSVRSATILIVDDIQIVREMTGEALRDAGYSTHECADGFEAITWFRTHQRECDLVILDLTMPNMSGRECFTALKSIDDSVKVIITSGHVIDSEISEILSEGAQTFLQKPFEIDALLASVGGILG